MFDFHFMSVSNGICRFVFNQKVMGFLLCLMKCQWSVLELHFSWKQHKRMKRPQFDLCCMFPPMYPPILIQYSIVSARLTDRSPIPPPPDSPLVLPMPTHWKAEFFIKAKTMNCHHVCIGLEYNGVGDTANRMFAKERCRSRAQHACQPLLQRAVVEGCQAWNVSFLMGADSELWKRHVGHVAKQALPRFLTSPIVTFGRTGSSAGNIVEVVTIWDSCNAFNDSVLLRFGFSTSCLRCTTSRVGYFCNLTSNAQFWLTGGKCHSSFVFIWMLHMTTNVFLIDYISSSDLILLNNLFYKNTWPFLWLDYEWIVLKMHIGYDITENLTKHWLLILLCFVFKDLLQQWIHLKALVLTLCD